jgi:hypothetical protein
VLVDNNNNNKKNGDPTVRMNIRIMSSFGGKLTVRILVRTTGKIPFSTALVVSLLRADVAFKNEKSFYFVTGGL